MGHTGESQARQAESPTQSPRASGVVGDLSDLEVLFGWLKDSLTTLASDAEAQVKHLVVLGFHDEQMETNELALELEDVYGHLPQFVAAGLISAQTAARIEDLWSQLGSMSGGREVVDLWTASALRTADEWARVRELAKNALATMSGSPS